MKEKVKIIHFKQYNYKVHIIKTNNIIKSRKKRQSIIGKFKKINGDEFLSGLCSNNGYESYIFLTPTCNINTLVHECYHAVNRIFEWIVAKEVDEEIFAYTLGYLVEETDKFYNKKK